MPPTPLLDELSQCAKSSYGRPQPPFTRSTAKISTMAYVYGYGENPPRPRTALERVAGPDFLEEESE
jgi:hypothetical protein